MRRSTNQILTPGKRLRKDYVIFILSQLLLLNISFSQTGSLIEISGKVTDQEISLREALYLKEKLTEIMAKNVGQKVDKVKADMERDFWMSAEEAVKYGLIDEIIEPGKA